MDARLFGQTIHLCQAIDNQVTDVLDFHDLTIQLLPQMRSYHGESSFSRDPHQRRENPRQTQHRDVFDDDQRRPHRLYAVVANFPRLTVVSTDAFEASRRKSSFNYRLPMAKLEVVDCRFVERLLHKSK